MNISPFLFQYSSLNPTHLFNAHQRSQGYSLPSLPTQAQLRLLLQYEHLRALQLYQMSQQLNIQKTQNLPLNSMQNPPYLHSYASLQSKTSIYAQELTLKEEFLSEEQNSTQCGKFSPLDLSLDSHLKNPSINSFSSSENGLADLNKAQQHFSMQGKIYQTKTKLFSIIDYLVTRIGKDSPDKVSLQRALYESDPRMLKVFDALVKRYSATGKCREDMSRYTMRKALTFLRDQERQRSQTKTRKASLTMCRKYFDQSLTRSCTDQELIDELLPYKKNSKNKTPNHDFTRKIFSSQAFCRDYEFYLSKFHEIMEDDNSKRIKAVVEFLECCVEQDKIEKIDQYKRLPWLDVWTESMYIVATELPSRHSMEEPQYIQQQQITKRGKI